MSDPEPVDLVVRRPRDDEQLRLFAQRTNVSLRRSWLRNLRWAGREVLASRVDAASAAALQTMAKEAGLDTTIQPSRTADGPGGFIAEHPEALGGVVFGVAALSTFVKLFFFLEYNIVFHFFGLLWLYLVSRDPMLFHIVGKTAGVVLSIAVGYVGGLWFHVTLAYLRLSRPLMPVGKAASTPAVQPFPQARSFNWARLRLPTAAAAAVVLAWMGAAHLIRTHAASAPVAALVPTSEGRRALDPLPADPWKARVELEDRFRSRPDRRFLRALSDQDQLVSGAPPASVDAVWREGAWQILLDGKPAGVLPGMPSFADAMTLLRSRARQTNAAHTDQGFSGLTEDEALRSLRDAQRRWQRGKIDPSALHDAAQALVVLSFAAVDEMQVGDALPARALAVLAVEEEVGGSEPALEALLASALGYATSARNAAGPLPAADPVRAYVLRQNEASRSMAEVGSVWPRILWHRRLVELGEMEQADHFRRTQLSSLPDSVELLQPGLLQTQDARGESIRGALSLATAVLDRELEAERTLFGRVRNKLKMSGPSGPLLETFEVKLENLDGAGPLFDAEVIAAYYRGALYTGIERALRQLLDGYGDARAARSFVEALGRAPQPPAQHLAAWAQAQLPFASGYEYVRGKPGAPELAASLQLGPHAIFDALRYAALDREDLASATRVLIARNDTRPNRRTAMIHAALTVLHDAALAERLCAGLLAEAEDADRPVAMCARILRDRDRLLRIAHSSSVDPATRAWAVELLADARLVSAQEIDAEFERLLPLEDGWARITRPWVKQLESRHEYARARQVIERWLPARPGRSVIELNLRADHARMLYSEGRYADAWAELEPLSNADSGAVMMRAAYVLSALRRQDEAEGMARRRLERFGGWNSLTTLLEILWRGGKADAADTLLLHPPFQLDLESWRRHIGPAFARAFREAPDDIALAAFKSMQRAGIRTRELRELTLATETRVAVAFAMLSSLIDAGASEPATTVRAAGLVWKLEGESAARDWLKNHTNPAEIRTIAVAMFEQSQDALLWEALPDSPPPEKSDEVWLLRAAAAARDPVARTAHAAELARHYAEQQGSDAYLCGRYLAGLGEEKSVPAANRTRAAWVLGLRAEAEGRRADALAWYEVAGAGGDGVERRLAIARLEALTSPAMLPQNE